MEYPYNIELFNIAVDIRLHRSLNTSRDNQESAGGAIITADMYGESRLHAINMYNEGNTCPLTPSSGLPPFSTSQLCDIHVESYIHQMQRKSNDESNNTSESMRYRYMGQEHRPDVFSGNMKLQTDHLSDQRPFLPESDWIYSSKLQKWAFSFHLEIMVRLDEVPSFGTGYKSSSKRLTLLRQTVDREKNGCR